MKLQVGGPLNHYLSVADRPVNIEAMIDPSNETIWATSVLQQYMLKGYVVNHNAVSEQKYKDLKRSRLLSVEILHFIDFLYMNSIPED